MPCLFGCLSPYIASENEYPTTTTTEVIDDSDDETIPTEE